VRAAAVKRVVNSPAAGVNPAVNDPNPVRVNPAAGSVHSPAVGLVNPAAASVLSPAVKGAVSVRVPVLV